LVKNFKNEETNLSIIRKISKRFAPHKQFFSLRVILNTRGKKNKRKKENLIYIYLFITTFNYPPRQVAVGKLLIVQVGKLDIKLLTFT